jgi:hypothetical protein
MSATDDLHLAVGEANGKLDTLLRLVRDHIEQDDRRFGEVDTEIKAHAKDINQAKGAKVALFAAAAGVAGLVSTAVAIAHSLIK